MGKGYLRNTVTYAISAKNKKNCLYPLIKRYNTGPGGQGTFYHHHKIIVVI